VIERGEKIRIKLDGEKQFEDYRVETGYDEAAGVIAGVRRLRDGQRFLWFVGERPKAVPG